MGLKTRPDQSHDIHICTSSSAQAHSGTNFQLSSWASWYFTVFKISNVKINILDQNDNNIGTDNKFNAELVIHIFLISHNLMQKGAWFKNYG